MSKPLVDNYYILQAIVHTKSPAIYKIILEKSHNSLIKAISEIFHNLKNNNIIPIDNQLKAYLKKKGNVVTKLASKKLTVGEKRKILKEQGFKLLQKLLPPALAFFRSLIEN